MKIAVDPDMDTPPFWVHHPDSTQAAVHLALQWLAFVYPTSESHLQAMLQEALPETDDDLGRRWRVFLEEKDIEAHVEVLQWMSSTLSKEQLPFLIEHCWRLLLFNHDLPSHVPLALRLLGRVLKVPEFHILDIGRRVQREAGQQRADAVRAPLLPEDPRYLDRVEWRLYGMNDPSRPTRYSENGRTGNRLRLTSAFVSGLVVGIAGLSFLVWGSPQLGREPVPRMSHQNPAFPASGSESVLASESPSARDLTSATAVVEDQLRTSGFDQSTLPESDSGQITALGASSGVTEDDAPEEALVIEDGGTVALPDAESTPEAIASTPESPVEAGVLADSVPVADEPDVLMEITASILNVRAAPSTQADIIIKLGEGARVWMEPEGAQGNWNRIRVEGLVGYASSNFMEPVN